MNAQLQKLKKSYFFSIFLQCFKCNMYHMPFECIHYSVTLFIFGYVHKIIPDPPLVISPPFCIVRISALKFFVASWGLS